MTSDIARLKVWVADCHGQWRDP